MPLSPPLSQSLMLRNLLAGKSATEEGLKAAKRQQRQASKTDPLSEQTLAASPYGSPLFT